MNYRSLTHGELVELAEHGNDEESAGACAVLFGDTAGGPDEDDEPCDWRADRAADAWERNRARCSR